MNDHEQRTMDRNERRLAFMEPLVWRMTDKGHKSLNYAGELITIGENRYGKYWVSVGKKFLRGYYKSFREAQAAAFHAIDPPIAA